MRSNGSTGDRFVYSGGARIATYHSAGGYASIESTNPVTGAAITTDVNAGAPTRQEPDPLGRDMTQWSPSTPVNPLGSPNLKDRWMPIEYTGGPSAEFGITVDYVNMAMASWDANQAQNMWNIGRRDLAQEILLRNPNVGIIASGPRDPVGLIAEATGVHLSADGTLTLFGNDAVKGLEMTNALNDAIGDKSKILNEVIRGVTTRFNDPKKSKCKAMFDKMDPIAYMANQMSIGTQSYSGERFRGETNAAKTEQDYSGNKRLASGHTVFNQNSFFFTGTINRLPFQDALSTDVKIQNGFNFLSFQDLRQLIVLHEMMHINDTSGVCDDAGVSNPTLNRLILKNCF